MTDRELAGRALLPCQECGMPCASGEYHPYAACLMFKACRSGQTVRCNLQAVVDHGSRAPSRDAERLDYMERTFSGMTNRERYLPVQMIWGIGANGRTLREACDKYMKRDSAKGEE